MQEISPLIQKHRRVLKDESRINRYVLIAALAAAAFTFSVFLSTVLGYYPLPWGNGIFSQNPERILGAANFFMVTSIGSVFKMWRTRQLRIKLLIAEAFMREGDEGNSLKLLLEPVFGSAVWSNPPQTGSSQ